MGGMTNTKPAKHRSPTGNRSRIPRIIRPLVPRKRWEEMSPAEKAFNVALAAVQVSALAWALWDIAHRPEGSLNGKKRTWVMVALIQPGGPLIYLLFGRKRRITPA